MSRKRPLVFVIHDLHPWGGHDRSTLEIARRVSHRWPVEVYAFTVHDPQGMESWGDVTVHRVRPNIEHPIIAKLSWFHGATLPIRAASWLRGQGRPLIHATGTCSLISDVVQVQFVSAAWKSRQSQLPEEVCTQPFARGRSGPVVAARKAYHELLLDYNVAIEHLVYSRRKRYIAISRSVREELREHFGLSDGVEVIHHGVDPNLFHPARAEDAESRRRIRESLSVTADEILISLVGAYERKGLAIAIEALSHLSPEARRRAKLVAIGGGAVEGFRSLAQQKGVEDRVCFLSHQKEIAEYYRAADLFLLPTLYEPFGLVILEAMASGLPAVVSELAGAAEIIEDGRSGKLIRNPADPAEAGRLLEPLILNDDLRLEMSRASREAASRRSWDRVADDYLAMLEPMLRAA